MIEERVYSSTSILIVGAHAFDAEVIAGPLAAVAATRGISVALLHLSMGEQGHTSLEPAAYAEQKRREAAAAAERLGAAWRSFDIPDGFVPDTDETALRICDVIRQLRPETVIAHWPGSWHKDHRAAANATRNAVFYAALPTLSGSGPAFSPNLLLFGQNWEDDEGFVPTHLIDVSEGIDRWRAALLQYELARGLSSFPYLDYYSALYRTHGCLRGSTHAQAFASTSHSWNAGAGQMMPRSARKDRGCGGAN